jgi:hypothetical protein
MPIQTVLEPKLLLTALAGLAMGAGTGGPVAGARIDVPPVTVIDRSLRTTTGELVSLRDGSVTVKADGKDVTIGHAFAIVRTPSWGPERDWPGLPKESVQELGAVTVELIDGTRLRGELLTGKNDGLVLVHKRMGKIDFPLDALAAVTVSSGSPDEHGGAGRKKTDAVALVNGDRLEGFIESIAPPKSGTGSLAVTIEQGGGAGSTKGRTTVPLERVAWLTLNGGEVKGGGPLVWLTGGGCDGERTAATEFSIDGREARIVRAKGALASRMDSARVQAALLEPGAAVPLASCAVKGGVADVAAGEAADQPLGTRDLTIPEPGETRWALPAGAAHITGWAVLPEECRRWGDCRVTITVSPESQSRARPVAEFTLNGAQPIVAIDADLPVEAKEQVSLWVTVSEGKNGPVQDRVTLRHVLIGFEKTAK